MFDEFLFSCTVLQLIFFAFDRPVMSKRKLSEQAASSSAMKKCRSNFKLEWLNELVSTGLPDSSSERSVKLCEIFQYRETDDDVICEFCVKENAGGDFSTEKSWGTNWKLDFLK